MQKNTRLLIAYTALFACAGCIISHELNHRSIQSQVLSEAEQKAALRREKGLTTAQVIPSPTAEVESAAKTSQLPRGIFLVVETLSVRSIDGQHHELTAGTEVTLLRRENGKLKVSHDGSHFLIEEHQVTRNVRAIEKLLAARKSA